MMTARRRSSSSESWRRAFWGIAVNEARDTEGSTGQEDRKRTSGWVFIAVAMPSVVDTGQGTVRRIPGSEGRVVQTSKEDCTCLQFTFGTQKVGLSATQRCSKP